ncbi:ABC transporter permease [Actinomycetospora sp. NBRC 106378]|uniref:ABC transporter permease n=1 Tax=Actinomycetospora sp. NBRC 106378 TaxID=3032208 RepID=UPI0024A20395|nr:ABC transporter permease [Actinomycetospora sp. NBRC 106378]GLZ54318.1 ABC transporter permease [Actinomycetospora sp. NBRC 106378]
MLLRVLRSTRVWLVLLAGVVVWQIAVTVLDLPNYILPSPVRVVTEFANRPLLYLQATLVTTWESLVGFGAAVVLGVVLGVLIARSRLTEELLYPYLNVLRVTPTVAIAPLLTIWFGRGFLPIVVVSFLIAFFPIIVQTVLGLNSADRGLVDVLRIANAGELQILRKIRLPNALPYIFASFRISAPGAVIGTLVGEFMSGSQGLGFLITTASGQLNTSSVFVLVVLSSLLGIAMFQVCVLVERRVVRWHPSVSL